MIEYYNEDCMVGMSRYPDKHFDLIITSPPYNLGNDHHTGKNRHKTYDDNMPEKEYQEWQVNFLNECHRLIGDVGSVFYNHKNRIKKGVSITPYEWILKSKLKLKQEIVWFNGSQNFDKVRFYPMTERIYWLARGAATQFYNTVNKHDIRDWQAVGASGKHTRAFPVEMVKEILACFPQGLRVLDPFMGSGTTAIACYDMGFYFVGFEIDPDYYELSKERI